MAIEEPTYHGHVHTGVVTENRLVEAWMQGNINHEALDLVSLSPKLADVNNA